MKKEGRGIREGKRVKQKEGEGMEIGKREGTNRR